jgi:hypothetical protein
MRSVLVVIIDIATDQAQQMPLSEHDDVVEQLSPEGPYPSLRVTVLPRRARRRLHLHDAEIVDARVEGTPVEAVPVANEGGRRQVRSHGFDDLLRGPEGGMEGSVSHAWRPVCGEST